jgi:hypothetical protein
LLSFSPHKQKQTNTRNGERICIDISEREIDQGFVEREGWRPITQKKERHEVVFSKSFYHQYLQESLGRIKRKIQWVQEILLYLINNSREVKNRFLGFGFLISFLGFVSFCVSTLFFEVHTVLCGLVLF